MSPEFQAEINKARTAALASVCSHIDVQLVLEELKDQVQGHRQRNSILDSQIEHLHGLIARFEAIAEVWEHQVKRVCDISHFEIELDKLTAKILREAAPHTT